MRRHRRVALALIASALAPVAQAQFIPYFGKNKVKYDNFDWRVYKAPHFEIYYYPEFEQHLSRIASYAESSYQKVSGDLKHEIGFPIPLILYKTHSEFEETNLLPDFVDEGILAFSEPSRSRMVVPIDEPPDRLQGLMTHELTHVFEFDLVPRNLLTRGAPLWVDEGLADYMRGIWDPLDLMTIRDAAVADQIPSMTRFEGYGGFVNPRVVYNLGHACFEFIEARYGKEGIRQFMYTLRKSVVGGGAQGIYQQAFRMRPDEFDDAFQKWLKGRFKPFRDKQRPSDLGRDLSPDPEHGSLTQVIGFAPSPSGEMVAALSGNRTDGELDVVLLSAKDRRVFKNLTKGFTQRYESISIAFNARRIGHSLSFDAGGDRVAFFARSHKRRTLFLASVLTGDILKSVPLRLDEAESPCLTPDGRQVLFSALKDGVSDIYMMDLETEEVRNLTDDAWADADPQISPDGKLVAYTRRISGHSKLVVFPLDDPSHKTQLTFGTFDDVTPSFSADGNVIYYASGEDDDVFNLRSLDLRTGVIRQYTDALGGVMAPVQLTGKPDRVGFITYFKGNYELHSVELGDPLKEVDQEVRVASDEPLEFEPDVVHQVIAENKRKKGRFEKLFLENRPPINVGVTSSGDWFGGTQVALADVLADQNFLITILSVSQFRTYDFTYVNLAKRLHYGINLFDQTQFFYASPYVQPVIYSTSQALATQRYLGGSFVGVYPFDLYRRLEFSAGIMDVRQQFENADAQAYLEQQAALYGQAFPLYNGTMVPFSAHLVQETTRFREFGPLSGSTFSIGFTYAPKIGGTLSSQTADVDLRKYLRLGGTSAILATRFRGFYSWGDAPQIFYFGGNMELRGFDYYSISGNQGFFANAELRLPIVDVMKTPIGLLGPIRGTMFAGVGGAKYKNEPYTFGTSEPGVSYLGNPLFGEPVTGYHLVNGLASWGFGLQLFFGGYPLHFDWVKQTDLKTSTSFQFKFWVGFDF